MPRTYAPVGPLSALETAALYAALGRRESGDDYGAVNRLGYLGRFQFGALALTDLGYVRPGTRQADLGLAERWTGKGGIRSRAEFLAAHDVQEASMETFTASNFRTLQRLGVVNASTSHADVAGYLAVAHLLGPGGARGYALGRDGADAYGTRASEYHALGRRAIGGATASNAPARLPTHAPAPGLFAWLARLLKR